MLSELGYTLDPESGEIEQLAPFAGAFSARAAQIGRNVDTYEAQWRTEHAAQEPGPRLRRSWDARAWADARPDKVVPRDGAELRARWLEELADLGFKAPTGPAITAGRAVPTIGQLNRDVCVEIVLCRLGARRSGWNTADVRGEVERLVASTGMVADAPARVELAEDLTARTLAQCVPLLNRTDVPEHIRSLTSPRVLSVENELTARLANRADVAGAVAPAAVVTAGNQLDVAQQHVAAHLAGGARLLLVEGAAGAGKTSTLAAAHRAMTLAGSGRMVVVTPTLKAASVAAEELGTQAFSAAWLTHQHGFRWDQDGRWSRVLATPEDRARLLRGICCWSMRPGCSTRTPLWRW